MTKRQDTALAKVAELGDQVADHEAALAGLYPARDKAIVAAVKAGVASGVVARAARVTAGRVSQIAPTGTRSKREKVPAPVTRTIVDAVAATVPATLVSDRTSTHADTRYGTRATEWLTRPMAGEGPGALLDSLSRDTVRVYLCGPAPEAGGASTKAERVRAWFLTPAPGWAVAATGHYLADVDVPVGRWQSTTDGRTVEVHQAAAWTGDTSASAIVTGDAFALLTRLIGDAFGGAPLLATPATTGRDLWRRTIPKGRAWPVLSDELRALIRETSGQGRIELRPAPITRVVDGVALPRVPAFTYMDGVLMYAGLTWGMPAGEPVWHGHGASVPFAHLTDAETDRLLRGRGRWRVTAEVPTDWSHVGLLPARSTDGTWCYPAAPGETFTTWADGAEVWNARQNGWRLSTHEGFTFTEGKPLDTWTRKLLGVWRQLDQADPAGRLARRMVRSLLLYSIGAFVGGTHKVTRTWPADDAEHAPVPAGASPRVVGDVLVWDEQQAPTDWSEDLAHPEYSATVWARARLRLLDGPGPDGTRTGALHLPAADVIGFATDALYLARPPGWHEGEEPGRFRTKGQLSTSSTWPTSWAELYARRDESEAGR